MRKAISAIMWGMIVCLLFFGVAPSQGSDEDKGLSVSGTSSFSGNIILGSPTETTIKAGIFSSNESGTVYIAYGTASGNYDKQTLTYTLSAGKPLTLVLDHLSGNSQYYYRLHYVDAAGTTVKTSSEYTFHTARSSASTFTFTVQADSHLDGNSDLNLYHRTLANVLSDQPDFHVDLGDTFMCEKYSAPLSSTDRPASEQSTVDGRYVYERANFGMAAHSVPLFLVNGNHEGEAGWLLDGTAQNVAIWASQARLKFFVNPVPDDFYSGDSESEPFVGKRAAWYAWNWGDALFVALDPFWNSTGKISNDPWLLTIGETQYKWLEETLSASRATFKFVFVHNIVGGLDGQMRGGIEAAPFFEWGGKNIDGTEGFESRRAGWSLPIHQLLVKYGVTAVFHGHDHLYAKQTLDGVVYQAVPQPGAKNFSNGAELAAQYHYATGTILGSSGHLRVTVSPERTTAQYVRSWLPINETATRKNGQVDHTWFVDATGQPPVSSNFEGNIVLGSPTDTSIQANIYSKEQSGSVCLMYGNTSGTYDKQTSVGTLQAGIPLEMTLDGLQKDTQYYYRLYFLKTGGSTAGISDEYSFHTARSPGSTFTFCIQGDSHPEREKSQFNADLYRYTIQTAAADKPDFYLTIGDDFSVDTLDPKTITAAKVTERYTLQRPFLGLIGRSAPVFLVNGNHEQAARYLLNGTPNNVAVWAQNARNTHFSQPAPNDFYTGNTEKIPYIGQLRNYYAWTWGDALFVVIDPYWASAVCVDEPFGGGDKRTNLWDITHGDAQYQWLKTTLEKSDAKYKFVFAHHVMGTGRGGIELAELYEWGGLNKNGRWGFTTKRPNWASPIHKLMADNNVTIFFQGHDHIWAKQELDGVIYQTLSEPADPFYALYNADAYLSGDKFPNTGYTRVTVSPAAIRVDYVRTYLPADEGVGKTSGATAFSYSVSPTSATTTTH